jgi:RNA polymerase sigma factor (sigma-70 family)
MNVILFRNPARKLIVFPGRSPADSMSSDYQGEGFPPTRHSVVIAAQRGDEPERARAIEAIIAGYWKPVYKYTRMRWRLEVEDAQDFTQSFFARMLEKEMLAAFDPAKGRLRTFLRTCVDRAFMNQLRDEQRQKRGSGATHVSLDFQEAEGELALAAPGDSPEDLFEKEWVRSLFALAVERLRRHCELAEKPTQFKLFECCDLADSDDRPSYAELSEKFHLSVTAVTNYLAFARREFRRAVLNQLREMTGSDEEFRREAQSLLGVDPK